MNITITGATGFIGRRLVQRLSRDRHQLHALSRRTNVKFGDTAVWISKWDPMTEEPPEESIANADAIVHLAGEPVAQRWTAEAKKKILESRVQGTRRLVQALSTRSRRPAALVCASAIGIYGSRGDQTLTESSAPAADYLAEVCKEWEKQAALGRPGFFPVPAFALKILFGEMAGVLLGSQRVLPRATEAAGYQFQYPELAPALRDILSGSSGPVRF